LVGALIALFISWLNNDLFLRRNERSVLDFRTLALYLRYTFHLVVAIVEANLQVALIVLNPKMPISPGMISFSLPYRKKLNKVILANSITLTPGTLTVLVEEENFVVHALTRKNAEEVVKWKLAKELAEIEERQEKQEKSLLLRSRRTE
jgi:multicomponent Na+:H+ antiporter subunit E